MGVNFNPSQSSGSTPSTTAGGFTSLGTVNTKSGSAGDQITTSQDTRRRLDDIDQYTYPFPGEVGGSSDSWRGPYADQTPLPSPFGG